MADQIIWEDVDEEELLAGDQGAGEDGMVWEDVDPGDITSPGGKAKEPWYQDFAEGVGLSGINTAYGLKDLMGFPLTDEQKATVADWEQDAGESGWGTGGQIVGELGQLLIPGGAAVKGARAAAKAKQLAEAARKAGKYGPAAAEFIATGLAEIAVGGGHGAIQLPGEGETRGGNAAAGAQGAALGKLVDPFLLKGIVPKTGAAKKLIEEGVNLTPGQAAADPITRGIESIMAMVPGLARGTDKARTKAKGEWGEYILREAVPPKYRDMVTKSGQQGYKQVGAAFDKAYRNAWSSLREMPETLLEDVSSSLKTYRAVNNPAQAAALSRVRSAVEKARKKVSKGKPGPGAREIDRSIQKELDRAYKNPGQNGKLIESLELIKDEFRDGLGPNLNRKLRNVDKHYSKKKTVRDAVGKADLKGGEFTPDQLIRSAGKIGGKEAKATGTGPLAAHGRAGAETVADIKLPPVFNWMRQVGIDYTPTPLPLKTVGNMLTGQSSIQKQGIFDLVNAARAGGVMAEDEG